MNDPGVPLMPSVARTIIRRLFEQQSQWKRSELAAKVEQIHLAGGGTKGTQSPIQVVKKALGDLCQDGLVENIAPGFWANAGAESKIAPEAVDIFESEEDLSGLVDDDDHGLVEKEVGIGPESVYLYFNPTERELAEFKGRNTWPCKNGYCSGDPTVRVMTQGVKTAFSRPPVIGIVMKTLEAPYLEKALHNSLRLAGAESPDTLGSEWFETSPERVFQWWRKYIDSLNALNGLPNNVAPSV